MNNTITLLERIRATSNPKSKNEVARRCGISESAIRGMYNEKRYPNGTQCIEIAKILRIDLGAILSYIAEDKARSTHTKAEARRHAPRLHPALGFALALVAGLIIIGSNEAHASAYKDIRQWSFSDQSITTSIHYAKLSEPV